MVRQAHHERREPFTLSSVEGRLGGAISEPSFTQKPEDPQE